MQTKLLLLLLTCLFSSILFAQTTPIASKSHSNFAPKASQEGGFGDPSPIIMKIIFLNDSMIVQVSSQWGNNYPSNDTIWNHPVYSNLQISNDSLKKMFPYMEFEGLEKRSVITACTPSKKINLISPTQPQYKRKNSKKKFRSATENSHAHRFYWAVIGIIGACGIAAYKSKQTIV